MKGLNRYFLCNRYVKDNDTDLMYEFSTVWGAQSFYNAVMKLEHDKLYSSSSIISKESIKGIGFNTITSVSTCVITFGSQQYKLPLNKKANLIQRLFLRLIGFKKA